ncbi:MAG: hypothetical protein QOG64_98 [Acidimicrobiaceae bacterium]|nr:hypothetical protein [Acidimicrobiaceae bacterium]
MTNRADVLLVTERAWLRFGDRVTAAAPGLRALLMQADGSLRLDGAEVAWDAAVPDIVWGTADLFDDDGPVRPFFSLLRRLPSVVWFQSPAAGTDAPVFAELLAKGVRMTTSHVTDIPIAEFVLASVLGHYQRVPDWRQAQADRVWRRHDFREVDGTTWLIVGLGSIGTAVAVRAAAFGARVIGCRRHPSGNEPVDRMVHPGELLDTVPEADVVVLAAPATAATAELVNAGFLDRMREGSMLVNIARGSLVDEAALLAALDRGRPEAAVLDVVNEEPLPAESPLWGHPRVMLTPHNSAGGLGRYARAATLFCDNLERYLAGRPLRNEISAA